MGVGNHSNSQRMMDSGALPISRSHIGTSVLLALISPALLLWNVYKTRNPYFQHFLIILFFTMFGATMVLGSGDAYRHYTRVELVGSQMSFTDFVSDLYLILTFQLTEFGAKDVYNHVLHYFFGGIL